MTNPTCHNCGSPWLEPKFGALFCCDCDTQYGGQQHADTEVTQ